MVVGWTLHGVSCPLSSTCLHSSLLVSSPTKQFTLHNEPHKKRCSETWSQSEGSSCPLSSWRSIRKFNPLLWGKPSVQISVHLLTLFMTFERVFRVVLYQISPLDIFKFRRAVEINNKNKYRYGFLIQTFSWILEKWTMGLCSWVSKWPFKTIFKGD